MINDIGFRIAFLRRQNEMTESSLADKLHISVKKLSQLESNKEAPDAEMLLALSKIFNCTIDYLVKGNEVCSEEEYKKHAEQCFAELKERVGQEKYNKFCKKYKFEDIRNGCFCFSVTDKELYDLHSNTDYEDQVLEVLIGSVSMKLNKKINGYTIKLNEQRDQ